MPIFIRHCLSVSIVLFLLAVPGCLEIVSTTRVNNDGSLERTIEITGDSLAIFNSIVPLPLDSVWNVNKTYNGRRSLLTATRRFENAQEMTLALRGEPGKSITFSPHYEKTSLWFFTKHRCTETLRRFNQIDAVPIHDYLSNEEIELLVRRGLKKDTISSRADSLMLEDISNRTEEWDARNSFEAYYAEVQKGANMLGDPTLTDADLASRKEELYRNTKKLISDGNIDTLKYLFRSILKNSNIVQAVELNEEGIQDFKKKRQFTNDIGVHTFKTRVAMPGLISKTNAPSIEGNVAIWEDYIVIGYFMDYEMLVESREINWWAIVLTGIVAGGLGIVYVVGLLFRWRSATRRAEV
ncbi:MAG: hypothetical protein FJ215_02625 [Ignavibacteria bacterium]|nr:hypothetical protein [Ignavibacteria bacterium]